MDIHLAMSYMTTMRVVLVEDHLAYRESFRLALATLTPFVVVGEADRAREAYQLIERLLPDVAVVDFMLPDTDAVSLARELRRRRLDTRMLILGRIGHPLFVRDALRLGVQGFALKREPLANIIEAMKRVSVGETYLSPELSATLIESPERSDGSQLEKLSAREREIFCLLVDGLSTKEIARALYLSPKTVDAHRLHINRKLGVRTPARMARLLADEGLVAG
jgi:DNA-binding NarL/FixJ family response regulator